MDQSEAVFLGECSFSKSWGLGENVSLSLLPLSLHSSLMLSSQLFEEFMKKTLLRRLSKS